MSKNYYDIKVKIKNRIKNIPILGKILFWLYSCFKMPVRLKHLADSLERIENSTGHISRHCCCLGNNIAITRVRELKMDKTELQAKIDELKPWYHYFNVDGVETKPAGQNYNEGRFYPQLQYETYKNFLPDIKGKRCLDIGCNAGWHSFELARRGGIVKGVDTKQKVIQQAKLMNEALGYNCEFVKQDFLDLEETNCYDCIFFLGVYYHLKEPDKAWPKLASLIKKLYTLEGGLQLPGGTLILEGATGNTTKRYGDTGEIYANDPTCFLIPTPAYVIDKLKKNGFIVDAQLPYHRFMVKAIKI